MEGLGAAFNIPDTRDPVALPSCETNLFAFSVEVRRCMANQRRLDTFKRVDADDRVEAIVDLAGDQRHDATASADMKHRRASSEFVPGYECWVPDPHGQRAVRIGSPDAAMLGAERATAGTRRNLEWVGLPPESEGDVPAVAASVDEHGLPLRGWRRLAFRFCRGPRRSCKRNASGKNRRLGRTLAAENFEDDDAKHDQRDAPDSSHAGRLAEERDTENSCPDGAKPGP